MLDNGIEIDSVERSEADLLSSYDDTIIGIARKNGIERYFRVDVMSSVSTDEALSFIESNMNYVFSDLAKLNG